VAAVRNRSRSACVEIGSAAFLRAIPEQVSPGQAASDAIPICSDRPSAAQERSAMLADAGLPIPAAGRFLVEPAVTHAIPRTASLGKS